MTRWLAVAVAGLGLACGDRDGRAAEAPSPPAQAVQPPAVQPPAPPAPVPEETAAPDVGSAEPAPAWPVYDATRRLALDRRPETVGDRLALLAALRSATRPNIRVDARLGTRDATGRVVFAVFAHGVPEGEADDDDEILALTEADDGAAARDEPYASLEEDAGEDGAAGFERCGDTYPAADDCRSASVTVALARVAWPEGGAPSVDAVVPVAERVCGPISAGLEYRDFDRDGEHELRAQARWGEDGMNPAAHDCTSTERILDPLAMRAQVELALEASSSEMPDEAAALCTRAAYRFTDRDGDSHPDITLRRAFFTDRCQVDDDGFPEGARVNEEIFARLFVRLNEGRMVDEECFYRMEREEWRYDAATDRWVLPASPSPAPPP